MSATDFSTSSAPSAPVSPAKGQDDASRFAAVNRELGGEPGLAAHVAVFCAALGGFLNLYCTQALYPELQLRFGMTVADAGTMLTATTLGLAVAAPFAGQGASRLGPRLAILTGIAALAAGALMLGFTNQPRLLFALRLYQGLLIPVVLSALLASINELWSGRQALAASATYVTGTVLGGLIGRFLPALLLPRLGWRGAFICFAGVQLLLLSLIWALYPRRDSKMPVAAPIRTWLAELGPMLRSQLAGVSTAGFCLLFTQTAVTTYIAVRLASRPYGWRTEALGALYAVFLPALIFVRLTPRAIVRVGSTRTLSYALLLSWVGLALTACSPVVVIVLGLVLFSVSVFISQTVLAHLVGSAADEKKEMAAGLYLSFYYLGGSAGALVPAVIWSAWGWPGCLALIGLLQLGGLAIIRATHWPRSIRVAS